mmetsp:Transcript_21994/g.48014  ORF Transcript_21994/g.48014 Transcript_21994/m.48014 type:complete len:464 (+) Transcript_21994:254-1645(+)|eukprot:CAMPEP_0202893734 /NCGR_PEP_ID=MMETSP1392-20130828/3263_1 /ASSEMBLY_ACC=CAM_ASM_000868 /TAXON_ID=225041 /ORGANISM="Chlamydomonas chlamydogama, Strain SAG 11-48b" /LENGTH=463 /DNA_ID=CAMNT_0049578175 /DNA_START=226 /DNA_END=1617 /DNA_ORIENTATION=-
MASQGSPVRPSSPELDLPPLIKKELSEVDSNLYTSVALWLRKHGKAVKPKLSKEQLDQLKECFNLMDQDGSGAIDVEELGAAFKLLGIRMKNSEILELVKTVDHDGSGELEMAEFLEIMTFTMQKVAEERAAKNEEQVPFGLVATAYRRKRLMEGIMTSDREVQAQIAQMSDRLAQEAMLAANKEEGAARRYRGPRDFRDRFESDAKLKQSVFGKARIQRLSMMNLDQSVIASLPLDEQRIVLDTVAAAQQSGTTPSTSHTPGLQSAGGRTRASASSLPASASAVAAAAVSSANRRESNASRGGLVSAVPGPRYPHYSQQPRHKQLMETPQVFDLKFSKPIIKLPAGASTSGSFNRSLTTSALPTTESSSPSDSRSISPATSGHVLPGSRMGGSRGSSPYRTMPGSSSPQMSAPGGFSGAVRMAGVSVTGSNHSGMGHGLGTTSPSPTLMHSVSGGLTGGRRF